MKLSLSTSTLAAASLAAVAYNTVPVAHAWAPTPNLNTRKISTIQPKRSTSSAPNQAIAIPVEEAVSTMSFPEMKQSAPRQQNKNNHLEPQDQWVANLDYEGFGKEVGQLGKQLLQETGPDDVNHLEKIVAWRNIAAVVGMATMWMAPNPISMVALSTWTYASWTMIAHHTCHGGYNRVDAGKFNSRGFALGNLKRRVSDWLDWMQPGESLWVKMGGANYFSRKLDPMDGTILCIPATNSLVFSFSS